MNTLEIHPDNSVFVQIVVTNTLTNAPVNDAAVTAEIRDTTGEVIKSSFSLLYVTDSEGAYRATVPPLPEVVLNKVYTFIIEVAGADLLVGKWKTDIKATLPTW